MKNVQVKLSNLKQVLHNETDFYVCLTCSLPEKNESIVFLTQLKETHSDCIWAVWWHLGKYFH